MRTSSTGRQLICHYEGFSDRPYRCPAGYLTIGYGHLWRAGDPGVIDRATAERYLANDLREAERGIVNLIAVPLAQCQFDALVSFTYNLGSGALQRSTLRRAINREEHAAVPAQLLRWVYADGKKLPGLIRRRMAEGKLYQGVDPVGG